MNKFEKFLHKKLSLCFSDFSANSDTVLTIKIFEQILEQTNNPLIFAEFLSPCTGVKLLKNHFFSKNIVSFCSSYSASYSAAVSNVPMRAALSRALTNASSKN